MNKTVLCITALLTASCAGMGFTSDEGALKKQVSFDHDCPIEKINITDKLEGGASGKASFKIDACGKPLRYERMGMSYFDLDKGNPLDQAMGKTAAPADSSAPPAESAAP